METMGSNGGQGRRRSRAASDTTARLRRCADRFAALGQVVRLDLVLSLLRAHPDGLVAGELQAAVAVPASTLSLHLDALLRADLVDQERQGRFLRYRVSEGALRDLMSFLLEECCTVSKLFPLSSLKSKG
jgi:DNA-binding transcriptional ArsR family regulator